MKKSIIIYNPNAGIKTGKDLSIEVQKKLNKMDYSSIVFILDKNFEKNIEGFDFKNISLVVAIGGDGTVKVATRTILENKLDAKLAIIPFGSANIVAKSLDLPISANKAVSLLNDDDYLQVDVGTINDKYYFIVGFSIGYISEIINTTGTKLKNILGFGGYLMTFLNRYQIRRSKFFIEHNNKKELVKGNSLVVFNACNFYGLKPKMKIEPNDGILNLVVITNKNLFSMVIAGIQFIFLREPRKYFYSIDGKKFRIKFNKKPFNCQIDGDHIELPRKVEIKVIPKAIKIINYVKKKS